LDVYNSLIELPDQLAEVFLELPSEDDYPDYYDIIKNPISFAEIKVFLGYDIHSYS